MMLKDTLYDTLCTLTRNLHKPLLSKVYLFHDIRIVCQTNHPAILAILDKMLGIFPQSAEVHGESTYLILCSEDAQRFPVPLPRGRVRTETIRLLTNTKLKYYRGEDDRTLYQSYVAHPPINEAALSVIDPANSIALTQLAMPERYQASFLQRYVFLLALGQLMQKFGFEPCHAGAVTSPWDSQQGALIIGPSGCGKTTLSVGCASNGCGLLGDDLVMLRQHADDGAITAHAISHEVSIRSGSLDLWPALSFLRAVPADLRDKRYSTIERVRNGAARVQSPIQLLLFPTLTEEAHSAVIPLSKANALQELVDACLGKRSASPQAQERLFLFLSTLAEQATAYRLTIARGNDDGPQIVRSLFAGDVL
jgi:hypothetical protein